MKSLIKKMSVVLGALIVIALIYVGMYKFNRWFNWNVGYDVYVEDTVRKMVQPECLKEKYRK